jgi:phosphatidylserine synthase
MKIVDVIKIADFFTLANLAFGLFAIFAAIQAAFIPAAVFLLLAVLFDFLDGKVARVENYLSKTGGIKGRASKSILSIPVVLNTLRNTTMRNLIVDFVHWILYSSGISKCMNKYVSIQGKAFGKELDSLADIVSFGAAPAVFGFMLGLQQWYASVVLLFFVSAGALRLSRFNITEHSGFYEGVPITLNGIVFPLLYFLSLVFPYLQSYIIVFYIFMGFAMLSTIRVKKFL